MHNWAGLNTGFAIYSGAEPLITQDSPFPLNINGDLEANLNESRQRSPPENNSQDVPAHFLAFLPLVAGFRDLDRHTETLRKPLPCPPGASSGSQTGHGPGPYSFVPQPRQAGIPEGWSIPGKGKLPPM